ncbi:MAG: polymerase sigma-B factor [Solirubrobacteraceae bacterium]|nr:polymerase sigma-B factor [Solirubrobacteraceae bacterium]
MGSEAHRPRDDPDGRARVIEEHLPLVEAIARRYAASGEPLDDLVQSGSIGLIKAVDRFDPHHGAPLAAFAASLIEGEIRHTLRARRRLAAGEAPGSLQAVDTGADEQARTEARLLVKRGWPVLSDRERRLLELRYFSDLTQAQIAERVGLSQASVSRLLRAALDRRRTELGADVVGAADGAYSPTEMAAREGQPDEQAAHSGRLLVRMPPSLHSELVRTAEHEGVSLNTLVTGALAGAVVWRGGPAPDAQPSDADATPAASAAPAGSNPARPRQQWLSVALAANFAVVAVAAVLAIVLLVLAWQSG